MDTGSTAVPTPADEGIMKNCEAFVKKCLAEYDGSHDFFHIERVYSLVNTL